MSHPATGAGHGVKARITDAEHANHRRRRGCSRDPLHGGRARLHARQPHGARSNSRSDDGKRCCPTILRPRRASTHACRASRCRRWWTGDADARCTRHSPMRRTISALRPSPPYRAGFAAAPSRPSAWRASISTASRGSVQSSNALPQRRPIWRWSRRAGPTRLLASGTYLGPLHGVPWGCKDLLDTRGILTGWGAEPYADRVPATDATVVQRLSAAGAVMVAKLTLGALAYGDIWYGGVTRNPWNMREGSSGSSAGSGSATAAGLVAFSLGTETLGSIVAPSLRCGTTGPAPDLRSCATHRRHAALLDARQDRADVSERRRHGARARHSHGGDPTDPCSIDVPFGFDATAPVAGLRLGYYPADFTEAGVDPARQGDARSCPGAGIDPRRAEPARASV